MNADLYRDVLSHWAASVTVLAVRDGDRVYGTTATSFTPVSADPPTIVVSLGPNAQVRPFLDEGSTLVVNLLDQSQARLSEVYADPFPVGPSPFSREGPPRVEDALGYLVCSVVETVDVDGGARLVVGRVVDADVRDDREPLLWYRRATARLASGE